MKTTAKIIALVALTVTLAAPLLFAFKILPEGTMKIALLAATLGWFAAAPFWLKGGSA